jgi:hypothetical protein
MDFRCKGKRVVTGTTAIPMAAVLRFPSTILSDTFRLGTLRSIVELQARWTEQDLATLKLID